MLDKADQARPELMVWRFVLFVIAVAWMLTVGTITGAWLETTYNNQRIGPNLRYSLMFVESIFGLLLLGIGASGVIADWYWNCWYPLKWLGISNVCNLVGTSR